MRGSWTLLLVRKPGADMEGNCLIANAATGNDNFPRAPCILRTPHVYIYIIAAIYFSHTELRAIDFSQ
jgi:hypothetical protein